MKTAILLALLLTSTARAQFTGATQDKWDARWMAQAQQTGDLSLCGNVSKANQATCRQAAKGNRKAAQQVQDAAQRAQAEAQAEQTKDAQDKARIEAEHQVYVAAQVVPVQWTTVNSGMKFRIAQVGVTESDGKGFEAYIVENLPESDIVGAPQSLELYIRGDCRTKVYGVGTIQKFSGKMGDGDSLGGFTAGLDYPDDTRRVEPGSVMDQVFKAGCQ